MKLLYCSFIIFSLTTVSSSYLLIYCQCSKTTCSLTLNEHPEGQCSDRNWIPFSPPRLRLLDYCTGNFSPECQRWELHLTKEWHNSIIQGHSTGQIVIQGQTEGNRGQNAWLQKLQCALWKTTFPRASVTSVFSPWPSCLLWLMPAVLHLLTQRIPCPIQSKLLTFKVRISVVY